MNNVKIMVSNAKSFRFAAIECCKQHWINDTQYVSFLVPGVVNFVFSCELYLKFLNEFEGITILKTHKLADLYENLSQPLKDEIKQALEDIAFEEKLDLVSNNFVDFRYLHESVTKVASDIQFLEKFSAALEQKVNTCEIS